MTTTQTPIAATGTEAQVCADIARRQRIGMNKYGTTVAENPLDLRQWLQHAYEEALDLAVYLRRAIDQQDAGKPDPDELTAMNARLHLQLTAALEQVAVEHRARIKAI